MIFMGGSAKTNNYSLLVRACECMQAAQDRTDSAASKTVADEPGSVVWREGGRRSGRMTGVRGQRKVMPRGGPPYRAH